MSKTYDFGYGPVPAHQHKNPDGTTGGWVADTATVSDKAYIGKQVKVCGYAVIRGGTIEGGTIWGGTIEGGTIEGGTIWGGTIRGGTIWGGTIEGGTIRGGTIRGGTIRGGTIWGGTIWGGTIRGGTITTKGPLFIANLVEPKSGVDFLVTITDHHIQMGCELKTPAEWRKYTLAECTRQHGKHATAWLKLYRPLILKLAKGHCLPVKKEAP